MMRSIALALVLAGCARHPVATVAVGAGSIGLLTCEANSASLWRSHDSAHVQATCGIFTAGAALFLGGLAALVTHVARSDVPPPPPDEHLLPSGAVRVHTHADPPPVPAAAGVSRDARGPADAVAPDDAGIPVGDAGSGSR